jgi:hypothetical protein
MIFIYLFVSIATVNDGVLKQTWQLCTVCVAIKKGLTDVR